MNWKVERTGFKRANHPRIKMVAYPGQRMLSITVSREGVHVSASGVDLAPGEWDEVQTKVEQAQAEVAEMRAGAPGGAADEST
jgi:hypothetical protein